MLYTLKDGTIIEAKINVVSFEFKPVVLDGELVPATDYPGYDSWKDAITEEGIDFGQITKDQAIAMGLPGCRLLRRGHVPGRLTVNTYRPELLTTWPERGQSSILLVVRASSPAVSNR
jgi:hypothetical protein